MIDGIYINQKKYKYPPKLPCRWEHDDQCWDLCFRQSQIQGFWDDLKEDTPKIVSPEYDQEKEYIYIWFSGTTSLYQIMSCPSGGITSLTSHYKSKVDSNLMIQWNLLNMS